MRGCSERRRASGCVWACLLAPRQRWHTSGRAGLRPGGSPWLKKQTGSERSACLHQRSAFRSARSHDRALPAPPLIPSTLGHASPRPPPPMLQTSAALARRCGGAPPAATLASLPPAGPPLRPVRLTPKPPILPCSGLALGALATVGRHGFAATASARALSARGLPADPHAPPGRVPDIYPPSPHDIPGACLPACWSGEQQLGLITERAACRCSLPLQRAPSGLQPLSCCRFLQIRGRRPATTPTSILRMWAPPATTPRTSCRPATPLQAHRAPRYPACRLRCSCRPAPPSSCRRARPIELLSSAQHSVPPCLPAFLRLSSHLPAVQMSSRSPPTSPTCQSPTARAGAPSWLCAIGRPPPAGATCWRPGEPWRVFRACFLLCPLPA